MSFFHHGMALWALCLLAPRCGAQHPAPRMELFEFREPQRTRYSVTPDSSTSPTSTTARANSQCSWIKAWPDGASRDGFVEFANRLVVQLDNDLALPSLLSTQTLSVARQLNSRTFILVARDTKAALRQAQWLSKQPGVVASYPVPRRQAQHFGRYSDRPNDPYFFLPSKPNTEWQAYLENRDATGARLGADLNVRAAWGISRGQGIIIAICDDGFEMDHPDLLSQVAGPPHLDFSTLSTNVGPSGPLSNHGTAVAGLAAAAGDNGIGISGVAPGAQLANWVVFDKDGKVPDAERLMDMFQLQSNRVGIQNHSWGKVGDKQLRLTLPEDIGISNAVTFGREGRGVIFVRAAGNGRKLGHDANDDGYQADYRVISVAAMRLDGRVASYSNPGACILVGALSGDDTGENSPCLQDSPKLLTTDRQGSAGFNRTTDEGDLSNYAFGVNGLSGTSAAAPQISGIVALILAANRTLGYRDVQQILAASSRHFYLEDPKLRTNGAGFVISHNLGFGVPDAGLAVSRAQSWINRPKLEIVRDTRALNSPIPDLGLSVEVDGTNVPPALQSISALAGAGMHPDKSTASLPMKDLGRALRQVTEDLPGYSALIQRDTGYFCEKLQRVSDAGASFAIVHNDRDATQRIIMDAAWWVPIPAVMINQTDGEALRSFLSNQPTARVRLRFEPFRHIFNVTESLICEHVALRVDTDHTRRGDLRITLVSPAGTRSVLQHANLDDSPGPIDWTYYSVHHFFESSAGLWTVEISDEEEFGRGAVKQLSLTIQGVRIADSDHDGLDDAWEILYFGNLSSGARDDPDGDGYNNAQEQLFGTSPTQAPEGPRLDIFLWSDSVARLSWSSLVNKTYFLIERSQANGPPNPIATVRGTFPETEYFLPFLPTQNHFFSLRASNIPALRLSP